MALSATVRRRLDAQGFCNLDEAGFAELAPWLRWSPALCAVGMAFGTLLHSPPALWALATVALLGAILPFHPFDLLYNYGFRFVTGTRSLPGNTPQRRFACGVAAVWLAGTGMTFAAGATTAGYFLGGSITGVAALVSTSHFCIPSLIYNALFRSPSTKLS